MSKWWIWPAVFVVFIILTAALIVIFALPSDARHAREKQQFLDNCARINGTVKYIPSPPSWSQDPKEIWCYAPDGKIAYRIKYHGGV